MKAAVSGLNMEGNRQGEGRAAVPGRLRQPVTLVSLQLSPWSSAWRPQLNRRIEQLQVLIFHLRAPAAPRVHHH